MNLMNPYDTIHDEQHPDKRGQKKQMNENFKF